jgi:hypothetical protein
VSASVFDDDFFRASPPRGVATSAGVPSGGSLGLHEMSPVAEPAQDVRMFAGANTHAETDELDIPAFLRRSS